MSEALTDRDCAVQDRMFSPDVANCRPGVSTGLLPSTTVLVTLNVVDPNARYWDPAKEEYVEGPVTSQVFYQIAGHRLDERVEGRPDK